MAKYRNAYCSFCRKSYRDVGPLIEGPGDVYICGECVELCQSIIDQEKRRRDPHGARPGYPPAPEQIAEQLGRYVSGQQEARSALAAAAHAHYDRLARGQRPGAIPGSKGTILLIGPTRSSRLFPARALAHVLGVPFAHGEAVLPTGRGGEGTEHPLGRLLHASDFDVEAAQRGIMYLDGADQPGAEQTLVPLLGGATEGLPRGVRMEAAGILFLWGGQFAGLDEVLARRGRHPEQPVTGEDLLAFGLTPELVDRVGAVIRLEPLGEGLLVRLVSAVNLDYLAGEGR
jgi:ATP-dependent Clp protease ATP-binding subunit ClpX